MILRTIMFVMMLLIGSSVRAEWVIFHETDMIKLYLDHSSIRRSGNTVKIWMLQDIYEKAQENGIRSLTSLNEFDCTEDKLRILSIYSYSEPMARGGLLNSGKASNEWHFLPPESSYREVANAICRSPSRVSKSKDAPPVSAQNGNRPQKNPQLVPLLQQGGTLVVPVQINGQMTINFVVDSGAADVSIPSDVVKTLTRTGTLKQTDFRGSKTYVLADGTKISSTTFLIRSLMHCFSSAYEPTPRSKSRCWIWIAR